ncbi:aldo-keto reductase-like protein [Zalerion maritima]|uniref:Aldo-keto reductase-like protein n=1 Tax=Zalerion maritima TaxID=339359 RepID=A0AAD5RX89_9PEZI|nr:aldo-keto reductase-like protein [Zalerion maritima]
MDGAAGKPYLAVNGDVLATTSTIPPRVRKPGDPLDLTPFKLPVEWPAMRTMPRLIYGTAWKKGETEELTYKAIRAGFRGVDTALQPQHYDELAVGRGIQATLEGGLHPEGGLWVQTKYSPPAGQGGQCPYDGTQNQRHQVQESAAISMVDLGMLDCLLLHSACPTLSQTMEAWMEMAGQIGHGVRSLGVCNFTFDQFASFYHECVNLNRLSFQRMRPAFASPFNKTDIFSNNHQCTVPMVFQGPVAAVNGYATLLRAFCRKHGVIFQGYWVLSANTQLRKRGPVTTLADRAQVDPAVALYALFLGSDPNMAILDGTKDEKHMEQDIKGLEKVAAWSVANLAEWDSLVERFEGRLAEHAGNEQGAERSWSVEIMESLLSRQQSIPGTDMLDTRAWQDHLLASWYGAPDNM